jgi:hypothetical protein
MKMRMGVDEARNDCSPLQVDAPRVWACEGQDLRVASDSENFAIAHGDRLGEAKVRIDGNDLAVVQHQIRVTDDLSGKGLRSGPAAYESDRGGNEQPKICSFTYRD